MLDLVEERLEGRSMVEACVINIDCRADGETLVGAVKERFNPPMVHLADVSPVVGTLVGPGGLGLAFYPED
jgi:fatty acid-binding protein DegV